LVFTDCFYTGLIWTKPFDCIKIAI